VAENATLRQEVERLARSVVEIRGKRDRMAERNKTLGRLIQFDERDRNAEGSTKRRLRDIITHLRRQVEEQAAKLAEVLKQEWDLRLRAEKFQTAKEQAESSLAAMTRERDEALAVVAEYKFGQTASARILRERDSALSRAEALAQVVQAVKDRTEERIKEVGSHPHLRMLLDITTRALAAPSEPKEGAEKPVPLPWLKDGQHYCPAPIRFDLDAARCTGCGEVVPPAYPPEPCGTCGSAGGSSCPDCGPAAPTPSAGEEKK
jgi:hypothetical protein